MATLSWPARAPKIIRQRSATCCGVPYEDSHLSSCASSAGSNLIARPVFGMSEIISTAGIAVKLFKGHYTSCGRYRYKRQENPERIHRQVRREGLPHETIDRRKTEPQRSRCRFLEKNR